MAGIALLSAIGGSDSFNPQGDRALPLAMPIAAAAIEAPVAQPNLPAPVASQSTIRRAKDGLFYVNVTIGNDNVRFLVDTGANITVLTKADAERLGLTNGGAVAGRAATLQTAGGPTSMKWTKIAQMNVANKPVTNIDAAIVDQGIAVSLLGQNVLSRLDGMTFSGDQLQFH